MQYVNYGLAVKLDIPPLNGRQLLKYEKQLQVCLQTLMQKEGIDIGALALGAEVSTMQVPMAQAAVLLGWLHSIEYTTAEVTNGQQDENGQPVLHTEYTITRENTIAPELFMDDLSGPAIATYVSRAIAVEIGEAKAVPPV